MSVNPGYEFTAARLATLAVLLERLLVRYMQACGGTDSVIHEEAAFVSFEWRGNSWRLTSRQAVTGLITYGFFLTALTVIL